MKRIIFGIFGAVLGLQHPSCKIEYTISDNVAWSFRIDTNFYSKIAFAEDLPVIASAEVSDMAVMKACKIVEFMLSDRNSIRRRLRRKSAKFAIVGKNEVITD